MNTAGVEALTVGGAAGAIHLDRTSGNPHIDIAVAGTVEWEVRVDATTKDFTIRDDTALTTPFTLENGAPSNALYVDSSGNVCIGGTPATGIELTVRAAANPEIRVQEDSASGFMRLRSLSGTQSVVDHVNTSGAAILQIDSVPQDGSSGSNVRFNRSTNTTGEVVADFFEGNNSTVVRHRLANSATDSYLCASSGTNLGLGTNSPDLLNAAYAGVEADFGDRTTVLATGAVAPSFMLQDTGAASGERVSQLVSLDGETRLRVLADDLSAVNQTGLVLNHNTGEIDVTGGFRLSDTQTVAGLPTGALGKLAVVTDANAPAVGSTVSGGGGANALVWYNGANWTVAGV